jgi:hypothetical protein
LLIGGIADIDVDDWKKHTDYRGYTESDPVVQNFWKVSNKHPKQFSAYESNTNKRNHRSSVAGTPSRSLVSCNSPPVPRVSPLTASRTFKVPTDLAASLSRNQAKRPNYPNHTRASTVSTCRPTRHTTCSRRNSRGLSRRRSVSARSKAVRLCLVFPRGEASVEEGWKGGVRAHLLSTHCLYGCCLLGH